MKQLILTLLTVATISNCNAQTNFKFEYDKFENQVLNYSPNQNQNVSNRDFNYGKMILEETKTATKNKPENFNLADYFNVMSAFLSLKESEANIMMAYKKFKNTEGSCEYFIAFKKQINESKKYDAIRVRYNEDLQHCNESGTSEEIFSIREYCEQNNLEFELVLLINEIKLNDQKYRIKKEKNWNEKQSILDEHNQKLIDSIYNKHNTYIGKTLVGDKFKTTMWAVVQHSNIQMMEKYIPVIHKAMKNEEIDIRPFKMLIDRFYGLKYGYQIFGSQSGFGFDIADEQTRDEIKSKYGIE